MSSKTGNVDTTNPNGAWQFDKSVTAAFDNMLERSIPQYDVMRSSVFEVGAHFVKSDTDIVDVGCSRGAALYPFVKRYREKNHYVGLEVSEPMLEAATERFKDYSEHGIVDIRKHDLRGKYPSVCSSLTLSIFTLQFVPIEHRLRVVKSVYDSLIPGGALVIAEKILGESAAIDAMLVDLYYGIKSENGYTQEQIQRKRLSLEGVLVPVTARWNEEILRGAGFSEVGMFWRYLNFAAWVAIK